MIRRTAAWLAMGAAMGVYAASTAAQEADVAHNLPGGDRFYRVLLSGPAETLKNAPLVVYLHPSADGHFEEFQRDYWPMLRDHKCVVAMPRGKGKFSWVAGEDEYVRNVIADVQKRYATDPARMILLGISGGGQVALLLADHDPKSFRAMILVSTNPVCVRGNEAVFFYPSRDTIKQCPYFVINHITQGSGLMYWRQVRAKTAPLGSSISIVPVLGPVSQYVPPPPELGIWLTEVLAGRQPSALGDPQQAAVAQMFAPAAAAADKALAGEPAKAGNPVVKDGLTFRLSLAAPAGFAEAKREDAADSSGLPITQIRLEAAKLPIYIRCDARATARPMADVLAAEEKDNLERGMLYQIFRKGDALAASGRMWQWRIGSLTYPDRTRGWISTFFLHAAAPVEKDPKQWLEVLVMDETQKPDGAALAACLKAILSGASAEPAAGLSTSSAPAQ